MDPNRVDRILAEWDAVAGEARRPDRPPRGVMMRNGLSLGMLVPAALVLVLVVGVVVFARNGSDQNIGGALVPTASPTAIATPTATASPTATPKATALPTPTPKPATPKPATPKPATAAPTPVPTVGSCDPTTLVTRITMWEGAAGSRIATVELTNGGPRCTFPTMQRPQLVDGGGAVLIDGSNPTTTDTITVGPGEKLTTLVQDSNYCGPDPTAPVTIKFVLRDGRAIEAAPQSPTDATVPPCNGAGAPSHIEMHPWAH
jgi:hypothetical protein